MKKPYFHPDAETGSLELRIPLTPAQTRIVLRIWGASGKKDRPIADAISKPAIDYCNGLRAATA
jgi:hypothetical protein